MKRAIRVSLERLAQAAGVSTTGHQCHFGGVCGDGWGLVSREVEGMRMMKSGPAVGEGTVVSVQTRMPL